MKNELLNPEHVKNINKLGKYDKIWGKWGESDLKNLKLRSDVSNEILDLQVGV